MSPDGRFIVASSRRSGNWDLWRYDLDAEAWDPLTTDPGDDIEAQWSPRGDRLVFTSTRHGSKDIFLLDLESGEKVRLTSEPDDEEYPQWSPDGMRVVYTGGAWGDNHFYEMEVRSGRGRQLSRTGGKGGACAYAREERRLVCHRYDSGSGDVFLLDSHDGAVTHLTSGPAWDYKPTFSPDAQWITYSRSDEGSSDIWVIAADGTRARPITRGLHDDRWPHWTRGGRDIFFHRHVTEGIAVKARDRTTGDVRVLVSGDHRPLQASLHPGGTRVAYCAQDDPHLRLYVADLKTGEQRRSSVHGRDACYPRWSPDGERLAFALRTDRRWEIAVGDDDGSDVDIVTEGLVGLHGMDGPVDWSPDGRALVFHADTDAFEADIFMADLENGTVRNLTRDSAFDEAPSWSPGGAQIAFMSTRGGGWTWGLFQLSVPDGAVTTLAEPDYVEKNYVRFGPDGAAVWTFRGADGRERVWERRGAAGGREIQGIDGARWPSISADGRWLVYTEVEERVEYWLARNVFDAPPQPSLVEVEVEAGCSNACTNDSSRASALGSVPQAPSIDRRRTPVDLFRR